MPLLMVCLRQGSEKKRKKLEPLTYFPYQPTFSLLFPFYYKFKRDSFCFKKLGCFVPIQHFCQLNFFAREGEGGREGERQGEREGERIVKRKASAATRSLQAKACQRELLTIVPAKQMALRIMVLSNVCVCKQLNFSFREDSPQHTLF